MKPPSANHVVSLLAALRNWRHDEKRHAMIVMGELSGDVEKAKDWADRSLHDLRIQADKVLNEAENKGDS